MPSKQEAPADLSAMERYNRVHGSMDDPKISRLKEPRARASKAAPLPMYRKKLTPVQYRDRLIEQFKLKHLTKAEALPAYDVTKATRYPEVVMWKAAGDERLDTILQRYQWVMKPQGVTAGDFKQWRESYMLMTREQLGALVRVSERTVGNWENGSSEIPFSMWWVMHATLQDPEYFLTRPGFHDFYIEYKEGVPALCSSTYPDIRVTPTELYFQRAAVDKVLTVEKQLELKEKEIGELTAENTRLRKMLKTGAVTAELNAMHEHLGELLKQIHTADVVAFPPADAEVFAFPLAATA